jgi:amino acid adenylation domain-containing protein/non-ribosomal peptide synthase protein (TIGR01720 family)
MTSAPRDPARNVADVYPLSPMQEGMLFHTLMQPGSGIYLMQNRYRLQGEVDEAKFRAAWEQVLARHPVLRTSFVYKSQKRPLQVVHERVELPFQAYDYRHLSAAQRATELERELSLELSEGLPFGKAPLTRFRLFRFEEGVYEFVHSFHHILLDEWCTSLLMMDFLAHYSAALDGRVPVVAKAPPYRAYIDWLGRQDAQAAERFFRDYLRGFSGATPLGLEHEPSATPVRPLAPSALDDAEEVSVADVVDRLDRRATERLSALVLEHRLTLNTLVQGAWALVLSRYSGERDVLFGVTVAGRPPELPEVESIVGLFINTLPLRVCVDDDRVLLPWLSELLSNNLRLRQFEYAPLVDVQRYSELERGQSLFESLFVFESAPIDPVLRENRFVFELQQSSDRVHTNYPVTVMAWPDTNLGLKITYDTRRVSAPSARRLLSHLRTVLENMAERPEARLGDLGLMSTAERSRLVEAAALQKRPNGRSDGAVQFAAGSLTQLFEAQVARAPAATAVSAGARSLGYAALNQLANRVAHALIDAGVGPESRVLVMDERGIELLALLLGVFKAGAAYVPVEPGHPSERVLQIERLADPALILTRRRHRAFWDDLPSPALGARAPRLCLEEILESGTPDTNPEPRGGARNLAYVMFTSGSTGAPKGVMIERRGMLNNMLTKLPWFELGASDVIAQTAPLSFDISVWQLFTALIAGARVEIVASDVAGDPARLLEHVERSGVTVLEVVPGVLQGMLDAAREAPVRPTLGRLRHVLPTGEALPVPLARDWLETYPAIPLCNAYGPAECSDDVAMFRITEPPAASERRVPIGGAIAGLELYNLDAALQPLPAGVNGELYVGGVGVGRGYARDPRRTAEAFVPHPFATEPGARAYRTGDRVRQRDDGAFEFVERRDSQVKIRGLRIELGEIEARLAAHPGLAEVAVVVREDRPGQRQLVAYSAAQGQQPPAADLRRWLESSLPQYMIPHHFVAMERLPRTPNGKVDRRALPAPELGVARAQALPFGKALPATAAEQLLAGIWSEVLGIAEVGAEDGFFELGGHSLLLTQVLGKVRRTFGVEPTLRALFEASTLAQQARVIEAARAAAATGSPVDAAPPLVAANGAEPVVLSFAQERLWFMTELDPTAASYNVPAAVRLLGPLDAARLARGLDGLVERHAALRARFEERPEGLPLLRIEATRRLSLETLALPTGLDAAQREARLRELLESHSARPFDLRSGPLARALLIRVSEREHVLGVVLHHIVSDGWSMQVLVRDLVELYAADLEGREPALPALPVQYTDYARWQRAWLSSGVLERQLAFWRARLTGEPPALALPTDHARPSVASYRGARHAFELPADAASGLLALARRERATPFMVGLAAFQILLWRYGAQNRFHVGTPVANRNRAEVQDLVGLFVNTLVLRADLSHNPSIVELIARVRDEVLDAQVHQDLPFERLVQALAPTRDLGQTPLFQVMYTLQELGQPSPELGGVRLESIEIDPGSSQFDLSLDLALDTAGERPLLSGSFEFSTDLFERRTIERLSQHLVELLQSIVARPEGRIADLPLLGSTERARGLGGADAQDVARPAEATVLELFREQVRRRPDAAAVRAFGQEIGYAELLRRARGLARRLHARGVRAEVRVCLLLPRSIELIVGVLGVLEAGGAYVNIDPDYPRERVRYLMDDVGAAVVVTSGALAASMALGSRVLCVDDVDDAPLGDDAQAVETEGAVSAATRDQLAYVNYTSGSTGRPKGVLVNHGALSAVWGAWQRSYLRAVGPARLMQVASPSFDVFTADWVRALCSGGCLVFCPLELVATPEALVAWMRRESIDVVDIVPALARPLTRYLEQSGERLELLKVLIVGSDTWEMREWSALARCLGPNTRLLGAYGVTETTIDSACFDGSGEWSPDRAVPLGLPLSGTRLHVLDDELLPLPDGVPGELCIGGTGVARGYWQRPALTAQRFVPDPFSQQPGARLYRTGDRARCRADGSLEFLGRSDRQVKLRGVRIELGEIEGRLASHPDVEAAAVVLREDDGARRIVAYAVLRRGAPVQGRELCDWLARELPEVMVPSAVMLMAAFPLTPHGKLDRLALPAPERAAHKSQRAAESRAERALVQIWSQVLGRDGVGIDDNFFELGGDSIQSLQVVARARQQGLALSARQMFQHQTIAELARVVDEVGASCLPEQGLVSGPVPLTPIQRWFFAQPLPQPSHWNQALLLQVAEPLDRAALAAAVMALVRHHDALRLLYAPSAEGWQQTHADEPWPSSVEVEDLSALPESEQGAEIEARAARWQASATLEAGPLFRAVGFELGAGRSSRLLLCAHHLVVDGVSWRILLEDLETAYDQARAGKPLELPAKTSSFKAWAERLQRLASSGELEQDAEYWLERPWHDVVPLSLDMPAGSRAEADMLELTATLDEEQTRALLTTLADASAPRIEELLIAALGTACARWLERSVIAIDIEGHGRDVLEEAVDLDVSRTVGWFTSVHPVLLELEPSAAPAAALSVVRRELRRVPRRGAAFGLLRELGNGPIAERLRAVPEPEIAFNYLGQWDQALGEGARFSLAAESAGPEHDPRSPLAYEVEIDAAIYTGQLQTTFRFSDRRHQRSRIQRLMDLFQTSLTHIIAHFGARDAASYAPEDFPDVDLGQGELDALLQRLSS